ncbi:hypothetical protein [Corynebacterium cystitidis]|uniref:hypothetical protein n=1 Tax=Corynebacterium cystitidis TaxID=35757 RepID=UPI00211DBB5E|nr:hypothetical protein [Corynebacterium cystitidis]
MASSLELQADLDGRFYYGVRGEDGQIIDADLELDGIAGLLSETGNTAFLADYAVEPLPTSKFGKPKE